MARVGNESAYQVFNAGWSGLILTNILIVGFIVTLLYYYYFRYKRQFTFSTQPGIT